MVPRDRIELPTLGFSVPSALHRINKFNVLVANSHDSCMATLNHAALIYAEVPQTFPALMAWQKSTISADVILIQPRRPKTIASFGPFRFFHLLRLVVLTTPRSQCPAGTVWSINGLVWCTCSQLPRRHRDTTISTSRDSNFKRSVVDFQLVEHILSIGRIKFPLKCTQDLPKPEFRAP